MAGVALLIACPQSASAIQESLLFADTFNTSSTDIYVDLGTRQAGILASKSYVYNYQPGSASISSGQLLTPSKVGVASAANFKTFFTNELTDGFIVSFKAQNTGSNWVSPFLSTHYTNDDERDVSRFGLLISPGEGSVGLYGITPGASNVAETISAATLTQKLGVPWNAAESHSYKLVALAATMTTGTYDLYIDGKKVNDTVVSYSFGSADAVINGVSGILWVVRNATGGVGYFDDLSVTTYIILPAGTLIRLL
jgi:hypothetical protein